MVVTVSGIFRDLLGGQMRLIDKAARLAAMADEPSEANFVRRNALAQAAALGVPLEEAATRVFANAPGSYGSHVNHLIESGSWEDDSQISDAFLSRKGFTLGKGGEWKDSRRLLEQALAGVNLTFQNIDSFEVGISDIDTYYESLGGVTKSIERLSGKRPEVLVSDAVTTGGNRVSTLNQMVRLETRAKLLNPRWYEAMLAHGYEGAREIETRLNNTYGWSATTGAVEGWVYQSVAETYALDDEMRERLARLNPHAAADGAPVAGGERARLLGRRRGDPRPPALDLRRSGGSAGGDRGRRRGVREKTSLPPRRGRVGGWTARHGLSGRTPSPAGEGRGGRSPPEKTARPPAEVVGEGAALLPGNRFLAVRRYATILGKELTRNVMIC